MGNQTTEIERTYLLDRLPDLPPGAESVRMEQGYFSDEPGASGGIEGRIRRTIWSDGRVSCTHTIKRGNGLVRSEVEREITPEAFVELWPATEGRRLMKTRHLVRDGRFLWEIDEFDDLDLVLAEVELSDAEAKVTPPPWLAPHIVRDVTEVKQYRNYALAIELAATRRRGEQ